VFQAGIIHLFYFGLIIIPVPKELLGTASSSLRSQPTDLCYYL